MLSLTIQTLLANQHDNDDNMMYIKLYSQYFKRHYKSQIMKAVGQHMFFSKISKDCEYVTVDVIILNQTHQIVTGLDLFEQVS